MGRFKLFLLLFYSWKQHKYHFWHHVSVFLQNIQKQAIHVHVWQYFPTFLGWRHSSEEKYNLQHTVTNLYQCASKFQSMLAYGTPEYCKTYVITTNWSKCKDVVKSLYWLWWLAVRPSDLYKLRYAIKKRFINWLQDGHHYMHHLWDYWKLALAYL